MQDARGVPAGAGIMAVFSWRLPKPFQTVKEISGNIEFLGLTVKTKNNI